ncbi:unannotated protein [freshwater metagenome]|uniref:Unannotated protein n=1 Tax=freshwater metagenome TaxID=449393 RepID=A0A6J7XVE0_9ZZZZ|nr:DUF563 domain-containing protein [Actinomycetota bacterium]
MPRNLFVPSHDSGSVEHYFHFLLGYLLPYLNFRNDSVNEIYHLRDCGPLTKILAELEIPTIERLEFQNLTVEQPFNTAPGYDSAKGVKKLRRDGVVERLLGELGLMDKDTTGITPKVLIIDRAISNSFYLTDNAEIKGSGADRRSIPNHSEMVKEVSKITSAKNIELDGLSLREQISLFRNAEIIIAQHGASLANLVFCTPGTLVIEIGPNLNPNYIFKKLAKIFKLCYQSVWQESNHAEVNIEKVIEAISHSNNRKFLFKNLTSKKNN